MAKTHTLLVPIEAPGSGKEASTQITQVVLRDPRYSDIMMLGEPAAYGRSEGGVMYTSEKDDVLDAYIRRLMIEPKDRALLEQLGLADTIALREIIFDFFRDARKALAAPSSSEQSENAG